MRGKLPSACDQCSFSLGEGRFADLRLFVFLHKNSESAIFAGQHLRTFMCVCICSLLGGDTASTKRGGAELRPAEERAGWLKRRTSFQKSLPFHSMCEPVYHILISLSVILLLLQSAMSRVPPSASGCKSSALIKPYALLTIQGIKKKNRMTISALLPPSLTSNLSLAPTAASLLADRSWRGC